MRTDDRPIAVFDSGLGGLTVVRELRRRLPHDDIVYLGDTARVPYGSKTRETVTRFTRENCAFLLRHDPKCIVAACNTASAVCLPWLADELPVPIFGVVAPGAAAAVEAAGDDHLIAVIATEATIASNAYKNAIWAVDPKRHAVLQASCPLLVPLVEEGMDPRNRIVRLVIERYLTPLRRLGPGVVLLGCTHYPMLRRALASFFGRGVKLIDSASATTCAVEKTLNACEALSGRLTSGSLRCYVTDNPKRFQLVGSRFLGQPIPHVVRVRPEDLSQACPDELQVRPRVSA